MRSLVGIIVWKELREIRRDPITVAVAVVLPLLMLYLFGSALSLDVKDASLAVYDQDRSAASRALMGTRTAFTLAAPKRIEKNASLFLSRMATRPVGLTPAATNPFAT